MGVWMEPRTVKLGARCESQLAEIERAVAPMAVGRSATLRWSVGITHSLIVRHGILPTLGLALQGVQGRETVAPANGGVIPAGEVHTPIAAFAGHPRRRRR